MKRKNIDRPIMRVGAKVRAVRDHEPFATPDARIHYRDGEIGRVVSICDGGGIELRFVTGIPTIITSSGTTRKIAFDPRDFIVIG